MHKRLLNLVITNIFLCFLFLNSGFSQSIEKINISGNQRVSDETIIMFTGIELNEVYNDNKSNEILKNLYNSNFFENISVTFENGLLNINVVELPIIDQINFTGLKAKKYQELIEKNISLKARSSYNEVLLLEDKNLIKNILKNFGYYFANVEVTVEDLGFNKVNLNYDISIGDKAKIKKISFIGNKIFKDSLLKSLIVSEEYKFWKFISGKKYLIPQNISFDERLLKNFYLNKGFYDVKINSSFAKLVNENSFELIFNINPKKRLYFNELKITLPSDFEISYYDDLNNLFENIKGEPYSINAVNKILDKIDVITLNEQYKSVSAKVEENISQNKIDINFIIEEGENYFVERINIYGNNITRESVIRNQFFIDEGDTYNEILQTKTLNNIKSLNFFRNVDSEIVDGTKENSKIINYTVEEKPTGEIMAGAGFGTSGSSIMFGVKENNYLGKGISVDLNANISTDTLKGKFAVTNPNYRNSERLLSFNIQAIEIDRIADFGYKTNKTGFEIGTKFEYLDDFNLGVATRTFVEKIETDSTASARQKKQAGNYFDTFVNLDFDYDKRNQRFRTSDGFRSSYNLDLPLISDNYTLTNTYNYKYFTSLYENNISNISLLLKSAVSVTGDDVKLTERLLIPQSRLRGFESGKVGPKDGSDFIGGNYITALNFTSNLPQIFPTAQNLDFAIFLDAANIWGVDYDSSINNSDKIRSSIGINLDWFSVIGPVSFSLSETLSKADTDVTESFRFNIGTTF